MYDLTITSGEEFGTTEIVFSVATDKAKATLGYMGVTIRKSALPEFALAMNERGLRVEGATNFLVAAVV